MNKNKLKTMEREFPFLEGFLEKNFGLALKDKRTRLNIKVERMDANLLYFYGDHVDGHQSKLLKEKQYGSLFTSFFFIDREGKTIRSQFGELLNDCFLRDVVGLKRFREKTEIIVKAKTYTWYNYEHSEKGRAIDTFKHFSQREIEMTIYKEPEEKLAGLLCDPDLITKVHVTSNLLFRLYRHSLPKRKMEYDIINARTEKLGEQFKTFFEKRLQAHMYEERSFNCPIEDVTFLSLSMAGRLMITLDTPNSQITFKGIDEKEGDSYMGTNSIDASIAEAERITNTVIESCNKRFEKGETFADIFSIGKVGFAGHSFGKNPKKRKKAEQPA